MLNETKKQPADGLTVKMPDEMYIANVNALYGNISNELAEQDVGPDDERHRVNLMMLAMLKSDIERRRSNLSDAVADRLNRRADTLIEQLEKLTGVTLDEYCSILDQLKTEPVPLAVFVKRLKENCL